MKKQVITYSILVLFFGLIPAASAQSIGYEYSVEKEDDGAWWIEMDKNAIRSGNILYANREARLGVMAKTGYSAVITLTISNTNQVEKNNEEAIIYRRIKKAPDETLSVPASVTLANNEVLHLKTGTVMGSVHPDFYMAYGKKWRCKRTELYLIFTSRDIAYSTLENLNAMDEIARHQYLTSQLAKYDIKEINIDGLIFPFENFRSAPTFKSIFAKLAELTGNADYYDSSGTPRHADQSPDPAPQSKPQAAVTSAENLSTTIEHNAQLNGLTGMWLRSEFTIHGMCRKKGWVVFYFYFEDGKALKDYNNSYATADGKVAAIVEFVPPYADGRINAAGFVPYSELHLASGHHKLAVYTAIFDDNQRELLRGDWLFFQINQP